MRRGSRGDGDEEGNAAPGTAPAPGTARTPTATRYAALARAMPKRSPAAGAPTIDDAATAAVEHKDAGHPVDGGVAARVGGYLGHDLGGVRVHDDPLAQQATEAMGARAFAYGADVFLGPNERGDDLALMAHELTHVVQQGAAGERTPQREVTVGAANSPAEQQADQVAAGVVAGDHPLLVDDGAIADGQMLKSAFIDQLRAQVAAAADEELGPLYSGLSCPYIDRYFGRYAGRPAADAEAFLRRFVPGAAAIRRADQLIPATVARVREGVRGWRDTGQVPPEVAAIDGPAAATAGATPRPGAPGAPIAAPGSPAQAKLALDEGSAVDGRIAGAAGQAYGDDFADVRVHTGPEAARLAAEHGAPAVAFGTDIAFAPGQYTPGSPAGDAMIAHELAHVSQQRGADPATAMRATAEDGAAEADANRAAGGLFARLWRSLSGGERSAEAEVEAPSVRTGLQFQRCNTPTWTETPGLGARLGVTIGMNPDPSAGHPAVVGTSPQLSIVQPRGTDAIVYHWEGTRLSDNQRVLDASGENQRVLVSAPGAWRVRAQIAHFEPGNVLAWEWIERTFTAVTAADRATTVLGTTQDESYNAQRSAQELALALITPQNPAVGSAPVLVRGTAPNPQVVGTPGALMMFDLVRQAPAQSGETVHWYTRPFSFENMPAQLDGHPRVTVDGVEMYDLGTSPTAQFRATHANTYAIAAHVYRNGVKVGEHTYTQSVQTQGTIDQARTLRAEMDVVDQAVQGLETSMVNGQPQPRTAPVTAIHVNDQTGAETRLNMYIGRLASDPTRLVLVHSTAGLDPSHERLRMEGTSVDDLFAQFDSNNHLPSGQVAIRVTGGIVPNVPASTRTIRTTGNTALGTAAGVFGGLALVLGVAAIPFTGGGSMVATALIIGSGVAGATAGTLSLIDHLRTSRLDAAAVTLDVLTIAASFLNGAAAFRAMQGGPVVLTATRSGQFLLWSAFTTDAVSALLVTVEGAAQIRRILDSNLPPDEQRRAIVQIVANMILSGGLLALSVGQMQQMRQKIANGVGDAVEGTLSTSARMTLSHFDEATLQALRGAQAPDLERLVLMLREDPSALGRLMQARGRLLAALQATTSNSIMDLEVAMLQARMTDLGIAADAGGRIITSLRGSGMNAAVMHALDDATLRRLRAADEHMAAGRMTDAMHEFDAITNLSPELRQQVETAMARANGRPDPAWQRDPRQALRTKFPARDDAFWRRLTGLDADALRRLETAAEADLEAIATMCDRNAAATNTLLKGVGYPSITKFADCEGAALVRYAGLAADVLARFTACTRATITRFGGLTATAFNRYAGIAYTTDQLNKLGNVEAASLENLAGMANVNQFNFATRVLTDGALGHIGQLRPAEIDTLITKVGTNPARLNGLGTLEVGPLREMIALPDAQLVRFANLPPTELAGFSGLTTAELQRFALVDAANLGKFGRLGDITRLRAFAAHSDAEVARFGTVSDAALATWSRAQPASRTAALAAVDNVGLGKLGLLPVASLDTAATMTAQELRQLSVLDPAGLAAVGALPPSDLLKLRGITGFNLEQLTRRADFAAQVAAHTPAELSALANDTAADRAANAARVTGLDDPTINPHTGRARGHASEHGASTLPTPGGTTMSPTERRLRTGVTAGGVAGPKPPDVSAFASDAAQLEVERLATVDLQAQIAAGNWRGPGTNGRHEIRVNLDGCGYSYRIEGATLDASGNLVGGRMVETQVGKALVVFEPKRTPPPAMTRADYFIVTMFPEL